MRIELTRAILMPRLSNFLRNSTIHFCRLLYMVIYFLRVTVSLLCRLQAIYKIHVPIYHYRISEGRRIVRPCDLHSNEAVLSGNTLQNINKCENGWSNFSENLRIIPLKLLELTRFASPNLSICLNFLRCCGSFVMLTFLN